MDDKLARKDRVMQELMDMLDDQESKKLKPSIAEAPKSTPEDATEADIDSTMPTDRADKEGQLSDDELKALLRDYMNGR